MTLYNGIFFFTVIFVLLIPAVFLGLNERTIHRYGLFVTIIGLALTLGDNKLECLLLLMVYLFDLLLVKGYLYLRQVKSERWILRGLLVLAVSPLILIKVLHPMHSYIKLLGISYLTFRVVEILIEIYDGLIKEIKTFEFTYFILFFPTFSSGPIDRFRRFTGNLNEKLTSQQYIGYCKKGIYKLFLGLGYKYIFAVLISALWMDKIPKVQSIFNTMSYMYAYTLYLFFDFAGYSLMAIGISYILGIWVPENFNKPFLSQSIKDFWNRWHMSLSFWFRDYVYTRFVMQSMRKKRFNKFTSSYLGYMITMGIMGIWHGSAFHFIVYGIYHGLLIVATDYIERKSKGYRNFKKSRIGAVTCMFITFNFVCFGMLIFSGKLF